MNPYALAAIGAAVMAAVAGAYWQGRSDGRDVCQAAQVREKDIATRAVNAAASAAAAAISNLEVQRVEITQPIIREVREKRVYVDCRHTPDGLRGVNAALTGSAEPAGAGQLPTAAASR